MRIWPSKLVALFPGGKFLYGLMIDGWLLAAEHSKEVLLKLSYPYIKLAVAEPQEIKEARPKMT